MADVQVGMRVIGRDGRRGRAAGRWEGGSGDIPTVDVAWDDGTVSTSLRVYLVEAAPDPADLPRLNLRERVALAGIVRYVETRGISPSTRDVAEICGLSSTSSAQYVLDCLENKGRIRRIRSVPRSIVIITTEATDD